MKALEEYPIVGIADLRGCVEVHAFIKELILGGPLIGKINDIIVDFGNPRFQPVLDRFVLSGEMVPRAVLRHVWDDTTESLDLTFDSPVYQEFFDAVRSVNLTLSPKQKIRVVLGDSPVDWDHVRNKNDLDSFLGQMRSETLADKVNAVLSEGRRALLITAAREQFRSGTPGNARSLLEKQHPGQFISILPQGRFGAADTYKKIEAMESSWQPNTIARIKDTALAEVKTSGDSGSPALGDAVDAILYVGPSDALTRLYPWALIFQDNEYWDELSRRSRAVNAELFRLSKTNFDLRSIRKLREPQYDPDHPFSSKRLNPAAAAALYSRSPDPTMKPVNGIDFILEMLDRYPVVAIADDHTGLERYEFVEQLIEDRRLPEKLNDIIVEFGNPFFQSVMDRYVVDGDEIPREERKLAWEYTAEGWYATDSPVSEKFFDRVREINQRLPREKRMRVIFGDAAIDPGELRKNPDVYLHDFDVYKETAKDPREIALAASVVSAIEQGRRALMICGNGHLRKPGRPGNARELIEKQTPGKFFLLDLLYRDSDVPFGSVVLTGDQALLSLGPAGSWTSVRIPPLVFRDSEYWHDIRVMDRILRHQDTDLASPSMEYRGRYFADPVPSWLAGAVDLQ